MYTHIYVHMMNVYMCQLQSHSSIYRRCASDVTQKTGHFGDQLIIREIKTIPDEHSYLFQIK